MLMSENDRKRWLKSSLIVLIVFILLSLYLFIRRGNYNLYIMNKVFGSTAVVIAGFTLLIGPLSRKINSFITFMTVRRHLGLTAFGLALAHTVTSFFFLSYKFPIPWFMKELIPIGFGLLALLFWVYLAYISTNKKIQQMGPEVWKKHQSLVGKIAFLSIYLHLVVMKHQGWINWLNGKVKPSPELANPSYPPASIFVFLFMTGVIAYRIILFIIIKNKKVETVPKNGDGPP